MLESLPPDEPVIVAGDFNDWRLKANVRLSDYLVEAVGKPTSSFPAHLPMLRLDRIYLRNAQACPARVLSGYPWSHLSDHAPLVAQVTQPCATP